MDTILDVLGAIAEAALKVWPGVLGAALLGYLAYGRLGFIGFWAGVALGALAGTAIGARFALVKRSKGAGMSLPELLPTATGAFAIVAAGYLLLQFIYILLAAAAVLAVLAVWAQA